TARLLHLDSRTATQLQPVPKTKLYGTTVRLELTKLGTNRVRLVRKMVGATATAEFPGSFDDLSAELLRTRTSIAKTVRGASLELCQLHGNSFTVQVEGGMTPLASAPPGTPARIVEEGAATGGGLAMLAPIVGEGIGTNVFR